MTIPERYTKVAILLHWIIALLILINLALPFIWENLVAEEQAGALVGLHKSIGISVLGLVLMRVLWRATHRPPAYPHLYAAWERGLARVVHGALYLLMIGVPAAGYIMDSAWKGAAKYPLMLFGMPFPRIDAITQMDPAAREELHHLFEEIHELGGYLLIALIALHILGALKHQFIDRHPEFERMSLRNRN